MNEYTPPTINDCMVKGVWCQLGKNKDFNSAGITLPPQAAGLIYIPSKLFTVANQDAGRSVTTAGDRYFEDISIETPDSQESLRIFEIASLRWLFKCRTYLIQTKNQLSRFLEAEVTVLMIRKAQSDTLVQLSIAGGEFPLRSQGTFYGSANTHSPVTLSCIFDLPED